MVQGWTLWRSAAGALSVVACVTFLSSAAWAGDTDDAPSRWLVAQTPAAAATPAGAATTQSSAISSSSVKASTAPAEAAETTWPPGLLMEGLGALGARKPLDDLGLRLWGFEEAGFMGRLTGGQDPLDYRSFDARRPNNVRQHQLRLTLDRPYDAAKSFDVGGRIDGLFGGDAMLTRSPGLFDKAGEGYGDAWADLAQAYVQGWFKTGAGSGLEVTAGKFATPLGLEVTDAPGNLLYSHGYLFSFAVPVSHTGVKLNYIFSPQWSAYFAMVQGWEVFQDNNDAHSYLAGVAWTSPNQVGGHTSDTVNLNVITGPEQDDVVHAYRTVVDVIYTHWWTGQLSQAINADFGTEDDAALPSTIVFVPGPYPPLVTAREGRARWYGVAHYLSYIFCDSVTGVWRAEWFRDEGGSRTGFDGSLFGNTLGLNITPWAKDKVLQNLMLRPEVRWDFACDRAFRGEEHRDQVTAGVDVIFKF
jgi:hypothetical protein